MKAISLMYLFWIHTEYKAIARDLRSARDWHERLGYMLRGAGWVSEEARNTIVT